MARCLADVRVGAERIVGNAAVSFTGLLFYQVKLFLDTKESKPCERVTTVYFHPCLRFHEQTADFK